MKRASFPVIQRDEVVLGESLGGGASGDVYAATYRGQAVAVKVSERNRELLWTRVETAS